MFIDRKCKAPGITFQGFCYQPETPIIITIGYVGVIL
jgi:hypothetical protein